MVPGVELVAGYLFAWAVRKARRVGSKADGEVDRILDAGMDELHQVVTAKLGGDAALVRLERDAVAGVDSERTKRRMHDAVEQAVEDDAMFAEQLRQILAELAKASGGQPDGQRLHASHTGPVTQSHVSGAAVAITGVVGGSINVGEAGR